MASTKSGLNFTNFENWLKEYYINRKQLDLLMYKADPFLKAVEKLPGTQSAGGKNAVFPVRYGRNPAASRDFSIAQGLAKTKTGARERFVVDYDEDFAVARISNKTIYASNGNMGAFIQAAKDEMDDALRGLSERRSSDLQGAGDSVRGQVKANSVANGVSFVLKDPSNVTNFDIGDVIEFASARTGGNLRLPGGSGKGNTVTVTSVNRANGTIGIVLANASDKLVAGSGNNGLTANDYIFRQGDRGQGGLKGLQAWIPETVPGSSDNFFGVNRSVDTLRLSGHRLTGASSNKYSDLIQDASAQIMDLTSMGPDCVWINPRRYSSFVQQLTPQIRYNVNSTADNTIGSDGFTSLVIHTASGALPVKVSTWIPRDLVYVLRMETFCLFYLSESGKRFVDFIDGDRGYAVSSYDDAGIELRAESYGAFGCFAPGCNAVINVSAISL